MMNDSKKIYSGRVKDNVVDKYIDDWYEGKIKEVDKGIEDVIKEEEEEDFKRNICDSRDCGEFSVFLYDGMKLCFSCASREIGEDKRRRGLYREVMEELKYGSMYDRDMQKLKEEYEGIKNSKEGDKEEINGICQWCSKDETDIVKIEVWWGYKTFKCMRCKEKW